MREISISGRLKKDLLSHLEEARFRTDELFQMVRSHALYERPIAERHRIVFYLGHIEAFDWNLVCVGRFGMKSFHSKFDRLFAFGIDPVNGNLPDDQPADWPGEAEIHSYNRRVRNAVDQCLDRASHDQIFWAAIEHRLMHVETLAFMLHWLPFELKRPKMTSFEAGYREPNYRQVEIPAGTATLGMSKAQTERFGWDNEFQAHRVEVPSFSIDQFKVTNAQFARFVHAGGYEDRHLWSEPAWEWITTSGVRHPKFWKHQSGNWMLRTMFADIPVQPSWPVYVSHAEAEAYARWTHKSLPSEAQFHRAAFGTPEVSERLYPWGNVPPQPRHGNFNFAGWTPSPVDAHPDGNSAYGVADLFGNGWEWTSTIFAPFPGFEALPFYPGYSADFFDGRHYVLKGGSPRTASLLLRRSFRNWFQPYYPNIYASFRCVEN